MEANNGDESRRRAEGNSDSSSSSTSASSPCSLPHTRDETAADSQSASRTGSANADGSPLRPPLLSSFQPAPHPFPSTPYALFLFLARDTPRSRDYIVKCSFCARFFFLKNANSKLDSRVKKGNSPCEDLSKREKRGGKEERGDGKKRKKKERRASGSKTRIDRLSSILRGIF